MLLFPNIRNYDFRSQILIMNLIVIKRKIKAKETFATARGQAFRYRILKIESKMSF